MKNIIAVILCESDLAIVKFQNMFCSHLKMIPILSPRLEFQIRNTRFDANFPSLSLGPSQIGDENFKSIDFFVLFSSPAKGDANFVLSIAKYASLVGKDMICYSQISNSIRTELSKYYSSSSGKIRYKSFAHTKLYHSAYKTSKENHLFSFSTPIIYIGNLFYHSDILSITLSLITEIKRAGYAVSSLIPDTMMVEQKIYPYNLYSYSTKNMQEYVFLTNSLLHHVEELDHPDVIVVQLPGSMMKYNNVLTNGFGLDSYVFSQAARPDYFILDSPMGLVHSEIYEFMDLDFQHKFGFSINAIHISACMLDTSASIAKECVSMLRISINDARNYIAMNSESSILYYNFNDISSGKLVYEKIVEELFNKENMRILRI